MQFLPLALFLLLAGWTAMGHGAELRSVSEFGFSFLVPKDMKREKVDALHGEMVNYVSPSIKVRLISSGLGYWLPETLKKNVEKIEAQFRELSARPAKDHEVYRRKGRYVGVSWGPTPDPDHWWSRGYPYQADVWSPTLESSFVVIIVWKSPEQMETALQIARSFAPK